MKVNTGIKDTKKVADEISKFLADSYTLYVKLHNFHWNVTGKMFRNLHVAFEEQYTELAVALDEIAERIRALGHPAPGSFTEFQKISTVKDPKPGLSAMEMVAELVRDHETIVRNARESIKIAEEAGDDATVDLFTVRMQVHEKTAWLLRSALE